MSIQNFKIKFIPFLFNHKILNVNENSFPPNSLKFPNPIEAEPKFNYILKRPTSDFLNRIRVESPIDALYKWYGSEIYPQLPLIRLNSVAELLSSTTAKPLKYFSEFSQAGKTCEFSFHRKRLRDKSRPLLFANGQFLLFLSPRHLMWSVSRNIVVLGFLFIPKIIITKI